MLVFEILVLSTITLAADLQPGKTQEGMLRDGKGPTLTLQLKAGDYVEAEADLHNTELVITVYEPAGSKFRAFRLDSDYGAQLRFISEATGTYRLEVAAAGAAKMEISASPSAKLCLWKSDCRLLHLPSPTRAPGSSSSRAT